MKLTAWAKLNLTLDVLRQREDGYHDLQMVMQTVTLADTLNLEPGKEGIHVRTNFRFLPEDDRNLAMIAAKRFFAETKLPPLPLNISIQKQIPVCAGLAGGSTDAAAVLRGLNEMTGLGLSMAELQKIGEGIGSDVPYCIAGGTALAEGRGERLTPLPPLPRCYIVLCRPPFSISTPKLFGQIRCRKNRRRPDTAGVLAALEAQDLQGVARRMYNVFEDIFPPRRQAEITDIKNKMIACGALGACMSGTGPTVFGLFERLDDAKAAKVSLNVYYQRVFLTETV